MKRCPQCEFIYEDDQSLCDMDGILLVLDTRSLPPLQQASVPNDEASVQRKNHLVPLMAALILTMVLALVYYVSMQKRSAREYAQAELSQTSTAAEPQPASSAETNVLATTTPVAHPETDEPAKIESNAVVNESRPEKKSATSDRKTSRTSDKKSAPASTRTRTSSPVKQEPEKQDSKIGSFLKKTGRFLKKPFKH